MNSIVLAQGTPSQARVKRSSIWIEHLESSDIEWVVDELFRLFDEVDRVRQLGMDFEGFLASPSRMNKEQPGVADGSVPINAQAAGLVPSWAPRRSYGTFQKFLAPLASMEASDRREFLNCVLRAH